MHWETCWYNLLLEQLSLEIYVKWKTPTWENCEHSLIEIKSSWNISVQENGKMKMIHWDEPWTIHNSAVLRLKRVIVPLPQSATLSTRVWMDPLCTNVWTQWWGARFISSNKMLSTGEILTPRGSSQKSGCASRVCKYGRMSSVCLAACVTGEYARMLKTHAKRREKLIQEKSNKKDSLN